jgi:hypothetical protein
MEAIANPNLTPDRHVIIGHNVHEAEVTTRTDADGDGRIRSSDLAVLRFVTEQASIADDDAARTLEMESATNLGLGTDRHVARRDHHYCVDEAAVADFDATRVFDVQSAANADISTDRDILVGDDVQSVHVATWAEAHGCIVSDANGVALGATTEDATITYDDSTRAEEVKLAAHLHSHTPIHGLVEPRAVVPRACPARDPSTQVR